MHRELEVKRKVSVHQAEWSLTPDNWEILDIMLSRDTAEEVLPNSKGSVPKLDAVELMKVLDDLPGLKHFAVRDLTGKLSSMHDPSGISLRAARRIDELRERTREGEGELTPKERFRLASGLTIRLKDLSGRVFLETVQPKDPRRKTYPDELVKIRDGIYFNMRTYDKSPAEIKVKFDEVTKLYYIYRRVLRMHEENPDWPMKEIAKAVDIPYTTVSNWLKRGIKPWFFSRDAFRPGREVDLESDRIASAHILGVYMGQGRGDVYRSEFKATSIDHSELEPIEDSLRALTGESPLWRVDGDRRILSLSLTGLMKKMRDATTSKRHLPWEFTKTDEEKAAFLRGFFERQGTVHTSEKDGYESVTYFVQTKTYNQTVLQELKVLLMNVGLLPHFSENPSDNGGVQVPGITFSKSDFDRLLELRILGKVNHEKVARYMDRVGGDRQIRGQNIDAYYEAKHERESGVPLARIEKSHVLRYEPKNVRRFEEVVRTARQLHIKVEGPYAEYEQYVKG
ncbi:MAG: LAGLIDADG family homing endonuclease [Candidatus Altiarchaeota archaeon]